MSGHSKWSSIKHKKASVDAKRGKIFTRLIREITIAAKSGGGDPDGNPRLRTAIAAARSANMPSKNIDNGIKKGTGEIPGISYEEVTFEGYAPGGVAVMVECSTDNNNRTTAEVRHAFTKLNGNLGQNGCVSYLFDRKGVVVIAADKTTEDDLMEAALDAGAEDIEGDEEAFTVTTAPNDLDAVREAIDAAGIEISEAEIRMIPQNTVHVEGKEAEQCLRLLTMLDELDDVLKVSANFAADDDVFENFAG